MKDGKKDRAKLLLRKKKYQEGLLDQTAGQLDNIERLCQDLEFTQVTIQLGCLLYCLSSVYFLTTDPQVQKQVLDGLQKGNDALEKANAVFSLDEIESIMSDTEDAVEKQREIERMLSGGLTEVRKAMINSVGYKICVYQVKSFNMGMIFCSLVCPLPPFL